jgi:hypothetical protein
LKKLLKSSIIFLLCSYTYLSASIVGATKGEFSVLAYDYDEIGNMIYKSGSGFYNYNSSITKVGNRNFEYDANSNMTKNDAKTANENKVITYNSFNKPSNITTANVSFYYDSDGGGDGFIMYSSTLSDMSGTFGEKYAY